nr:DUF1016 N-terminal domain-containing protein [uncultured Prevotella sp.]
MRIENIDERNFYEIECQKQNWSVRQLQRQYASSLYERLALSRNKTEVMRLANEGQTMEKASFSRPDRNASHSMKTTTMLIWCSITVCCSVMSSST